MDYVLKLFLSVAPFAQHFQQSPPLDHNKVELQSTTVDFAVLCMLEVTENALLCVFLLPLFKKYLGI